MPPKEFDTVWRAEPHTIAKVALLSAYLKIEWTEFTWNPVTGCTKISEGCRHCYAERMAKRLEAMGNARYANGSGCRASFL